MIAAAMLPVISGTPSASPAVTPVSRRRFHASPRSSSIPATQTNIITDHHAMPLSEPSVAGVKIVA
jgi:hypothetical protein